MKPQQKHCSFEFLFHYSMSFLLGESVSLGGSKVKKLAKR